MSDGEQDSLTLKKLIEPSGLGTSNSAPSSGQDFWYSWKAVLFQIIVVGRCLYESGDNDTDLLF